MPSDHRVATRHHLADEWHPRPSRRNVDNHDPISEYPRYPGGCRVAHDIRTFFNARFDQGALPPIQLVQREKLAGESCRRFLGRHGVALLIVCC